MSEAKNRKKDSRSSDHEIWKEAKGFEGMCMVSSKGHVIARRNLKVSMTPWTSVDPYPDNNGYMMVHLARPDGSNELVRIHRLVAEAFIPNPLGKRVVNHKDGNKANNSVENLEWHTHSENLEHAYKKGLNWWPKRVKDSNGNVYQSITEAGKAFGLSQSTMSKVVNNHRSINGVTFEVIPYEQS